MEEIINSIMHNPENTNPNVLRDQLREISSGAGAGVVIIDEETVLHGGERLNIKAGELYNLAKNNVVFCKQIISTPVSGEFYTILLDYFYIGESPVSVYWFRFYDLQKKIVTFKGRVDDYPSTQSGSEVLH